jgi:hypothetical protein
MKIGSLRALSTPLSDAAKKSCKRLDIPSLSWYTTRMNNTNHNNGYLNFSPIELVAHLDMVGQVMCQIDSGMPVPAAVREAALVMLRCVRDDIAATHNIGSESQYTSPEYLAEAACRELACDDEDGLDWNYTPEA